MAEPLFTFSFLDGLDVQRVEECNKVPDLIEILAVPLKDVVNQIHKSHIQFLVSADRQVPLEDRNRLGF